MITRAGEELRADLRAISDSNVNVGYNNRILEIRDSVIHGDVIQEAPPVKLTPRARPLDLPRAATPVLLDRTSEMALGLATATAGDGHLEVSGTDGIGKTSLLGALARRVPAGTFADGTVWLDGSGRTPREDLLNDLFVNFFEADRPYTPTPSQARSSLNDTRALVILDDLGLPREDFQWLSAKAPNCIFAVAAESPTLGGEAESIYLRGLPADDALSLIELVLARALEPHERALAATIATALQERPLAIVRAMRRVTAGLLTLAELAAEVGARDEDSRPGVALAGLSLSLPEEQALAALAAPTAAAMAPETVTALTGLPDATAPLKSLAERGLVRANGLGQYAATAEARAAVARATDLTPIAERTLDYLARWAEQTPRTAASVQPLSAHTPTVRATLEWAAQSKRWPEAIRLARAVDRALTLGGRTGSRGQTLQILLSGAAALADRPTEAWAFNQLGSQALARGELPEAEADFSRALELRMELGDEAGAAVSRGNLELVRRLLAPPPPTTPSSAGPGRLARWFVIGGAVVALLFAATGAAIAIGATRTARPTPSPDGPTPTPPTIVRTTPTVASIPTTTTLAPTVPAAVAASPQVSPSPSPTVPATRPVAVVSPGALDFGTQRVGTASPPKTVTLNNTGTGALNPGDIPTATGDFLVSSACEAELQPDESCQLTVTFKPTTSGPRTAMLSLTPRGVDPLTISLSGAGGVAQLTFVPPNELALGPTRLGATSQAKGVAVKNTGQLDVSITDVATSADFHQTSHCTVTLKPGETCQIEVTFSPTSAGAHTGQLTVTSDASSAPLELPLSGAGVQPSPGPSPSPLPTPGVLAQPAQLAFDGQRLETASAARTITVTNSGQVSVGSKVTLSGNNTGDFSVAADACTGHTLRPNDTCAVGITFKPTALGSRSAQVEIGDPRTQATLARIALAGRGTAPVLSASPTSLTMSVDLGASDKRAITLANAGPGDVTFTKIAIANSPAFSLADACGSKLAEGAQCALTVTYKPVSAGTLQGTISVTSDAASPTLQIPLSGTATDRRLQARATSLTFANMLVGESATPQQVVLTGIGSTPVAVQAPSLSGDTADFKFDAGCTGKTLAQSATCAITVTFTPTAAGTRAAQLTIPNSGRDGALVINLSGSGYFLR